MPARQQQRYQEETAVSLGTVTAAGATADLGSNWDTASALILQLTSSAGTGTTPVLTVVVEDSVDGSTWGTLATFANLTNTVTRDVQRVGSTTPFGRRLRARVSAVTGTTPSFANVQVIVASRA